MKFSFDKLLLSRYAYNALSTESIMLETNLGDQLLLVDSCYEEKVIYCPVVVSVIIMLVCGLSIDCLIVIFFI